MHILYSCDRYIMNTTDTPQHILITGASSGIGRACAYHLDKKGYFVFAGVRTEADGKALKAGASNRLTPVIIDVCDDDSIRTAHNLVEKSIGPMGLDGLINNAGVALAGPMEYLDISKFRQQLDVNVLGLVSVTQAFLPLLRKKKGRIINMGSISGRVALPFLGPYSATKFAIEAITDSMRVELRPWDISVSIIEPGNVKTKIRRSALATLKEDAQKLDPADFSLYSPIFNSSESHERRKIMDPDLVARKITKS